MSRTLRLLAELVEGPAVRTARGAPELLAGKPFEQRVADTITCCSITVASVRTFEGRMGLIRGAGHVGPRRGGDAGPVLAREARIPFKTFTEPVLPTQALLVAAVGALGFCEGEEDQIAHLCRRLPVPCRAGLRGCPPTGNDASPRERQVLGRSAASDGSDGTPRERWRRVTASTRRSAPLRQPKVRCLLVSYMPLAHAD